MADYIKREDAVEAVKHAWAKGIEPSQYIEIIPAADVTRAAHGKWYDVGSLSCRCSNCGGKNNRESNYCPICGARMYKERGNEQSGN